MQENKLCQASYRMNPAVVGWLVLMLLLSPLSVQLANGQVSLSVTLLIGGVDDPPAQQSLPETAAPETPVGTDQPVATDQSGATDQPDATPITEVTATEPSLDEPVADAPTAAKSSAVADKTATVEAPAAEAQPATAQPIAVSPSVKRPLEQQLSVVPVRPLLPADRPNWITLEADYSTDVHRLVVSSIPTVRASDVDVNLDAPLEEALQNYVAEQFGDDRAGSLLKNRLSSAFIRANLVDDKQSYTAELATTSGGMFQKWVMVEVSQKQRQQLQTWYRELVQRERVVPLGLGVAGLMSAIGLLNLVFRKVAS